jgi:signal transduction histidine kinase
MDDLIAIKNGAKNLNLLYVEDCPKTRKATTSLLSKVFDNIIIAQDGEDGLEKFKENDIDLVIADIRMPKLDGLRMSEKIKAIDPDVQILVISAHSETEYFVDSIKVGIDGYLFKPLNVKQLISTIASVIKSIKNKEELQKARMLQERQEKHQALADMLFNIAHQWKQPLSVISTASSSIELTNEDNIATKESNIMYSKSIANATMYLNKMIDDFRKLFKDTSDDNIEEVSFEDLVSEIVSRQKNNYKFITNIENITIIENKKIIENILIPIISNALEALDNKNDDKFIFIDVFKKEDKINIIIKDNGKGIESDIIDKVFEPYFTTKHQSVGVGLSLFIVYNIITSYFDGSIEVSNESYSYNDIQYKGAKFHIEI